ncbi:MAG: hypothetical protein ACI4HI_05215 [Lachnospiraceae bacterium]
MCKTDLIDKIDKLSADDYNMVLMLVNRLSEKSETDRFQKLSEDALVEQLSESMKKSDKGETKPAREVAKSMREKYVV